MIKYTYQIEHIDKSDEIILDFDNEKSLAFASMITDTLGSDIPWRFNDLQKDIEDYMDLLKGNIPEYWHGGNVTIIKSETVEFVKIILLWAYETYKYKNEKKAISSEEAEMAMAWIEEKSMEVNRIPNASIG